MYTYTGFFIIRDKGNFSKSYLDFFDKEILMKQISLVKKAAAVSLCAALTFSMTACSGQTDSSVQNGASQSTSLESTVLESGASSDISQPSGDSSAEPSNESSVDSVVEEVSVPEDTPYTLGGELTPAMIARSRYNEGNKVRLAKVIKKLQANEEVTVGYIGGSITQGTSAGDDLCYARLTTNWLEEMFPGAKINYINAGVGATGSYYGVYRVEKDLLVHEPDLVFVDFSVNDNGEMVEINQNTYAGLLRKIWASAKNPAIVTIAMTQEDGTSFQEYHGEVIKELDIPMISYKNPILDIIEKGYITWKDISDDNIHPNVPGHALLTDLITNYLQSVIDDVDNISGEESNFDNSQFGVEFANSNFLTSNEMEPTKMGCFQLSESRFGGFQNPWYVRNSEGQFTDDDAIEFEFEGTNVRLMYCKLKDSGAKADVYLDGEFVTTVDAAFPNGWGSYVDMADIGTGLSEGKHTIRIAPKSQEGKACFYVSGLAVS